MRARWPLRLLPVAIVAIAAPAIAGWRAVPARWAARQSRIALDEGRLEDAIAAWDRATRWRGAPEPELTRNIASEIVRHAVDDGFGRHIQAAIDAAATAGGPELEASLARLARSSARGVGATIADGQLARGGDEAAIARLRNDLGREASLPAWQLTKIADPHLLLWAREQIRTPTDALASTAAVGAIGDLGEGLGDIALLAWSFQGRRDAPIDDPAVFVLRAMARIARRHPETAAAALDAFDRFEAARPEDAKWLDAARTLAGDATAHRSLAAAVAGENPVFLDRTLLEALDAAGDPAARRWLLERFERGEVWQIPEVLWWLSEDRDPPEGETLLPIARRALAGEPVDRGGVPTDRVGTRLEVLARWGDLDDLETLRRFIVADDARVAAAAATLRILARSR